MNQRKNFRVYLKGLHVGTGIKAERMEVDGTCLFFWNGMSDLVASFWLADVTGVREGGSSGNLLPLPSQEDMLAALQASL